MNTLENNNIVLDQQELLTVLSNAEMQLRFSALQTWEYIDTLALVDISKGFENIKRNPIDLINNVKESMKLHVQLIERYLELEFIGGYKQVFQNLLQIFQYFFLSVNAYLKLVDSNYHTMQFYDEFKEYNDAGYKCLTNTFKKS